MSDELLKAARRLIEEPDTGGVWPRATAILARQALEGALDRMWADSLPGMEEASRSTQMACIGHVISDKTLIAEVRSAWSSLSRACHHHHYELGPTAAELERWILQTEHLVRTLKVPPATDA